MMSLPLTATLFLFYSTGVFANPVLLPSNGPNNQIHKKDASNVCPTGYSQPENSNWDYCYMVHTEYRNRAVAAAICKSENGVLASVGNAFVNSYLYSLANQTNVNWLALGIECYDHSQSNCVNDDQTKFVYSNFYKNEPKNRGTSSWIAITTLSYKDSQTWYGFRYEDDMQFACEVAVAHIAI